MLDPELGLKKAYDVGAGEYDLVLSSGPMYKTARKEAFKAMTFVIGQNPQVMLPMFGDIWMKNADFPDADLAAERFKKMLPPNLQDQDADDAKAKLAQTQSQLAQMGQQMQLLQLEFNKAADTIRTDRLKIESNERIQLMKMQHDLVMQQLKSHDDAAQSHLEETLGAITKQLDAMHAGMTVDQDAGRPSPTPEVPPQITKPIQPVLNMGQ